MTRILIVIFSAFVVLSACSDREETSAEIPAGEVFMASHERSIQYVDSVPVLSEDVTVFAMQPVDEPYYDTTYNTSSLIISLPESDSIRIYSLPDFQASAFLTEENEDRILNVPEFNDRFNFLPGDSDLLLRKTTEKQSYTTYFHPSPPTEGVLSEQDLTGTSWTIANGQIDQVMFFTEDSCIFRVPWGERNPDGPYSSLHPGKWHLRDVDGRTFLIMYSYGITGPDGNIFRAHFIRSADQENISSEVYMNKTGSLNDPVVQMTPAWQKQAALTDEATESLRARLTGTWKSMTYPFATGYDHTENYDTIVDTGHTLVLNKSGTYTEVISGIKVHQGGRTPFSQEVNGDWTLNPAGFYIYLKPEAGNKRLISIEKMDDQNLILNLERQGFEDERFQDRIQAVFMKQDGT